MQANIFPKVAATTAPSVAITVDPFEHLMFSIFISASNEEIDLAEAIESALLSDDIIVLDPYHRDATIDIAQRYSIRIIQDRVDSHLKQHAEMLHHLPTKYDWVYILEGDERMTPTLFAECLETIQNLKHLGYDVAEQAIFADSSMPPSNPYPHYPLCLFRKDKVCLTDSCHTEWEFCNGTMDCSSNLDNG
jgi:glycosyltransferase involved in cell wall biosynthesis